MSRRAMFMLAAVLVAISAPLALLLWWEHSLPPRAARLLPSAEVLVYADLRPLRAANLVKSLPTVEHDADYDEFVRSTGIQFERDLDQIALAAHRPSSDTGETRYSEIFVGRFDAPKLTAYLKKIGASSERYRNVDVYAVTLPGRTARVALLSGNMVAASNTEGPYVIHQMIDRFRSFPLGEDGPELLRQYYGKVPLGSPAWAVAQLSPAGAKGNASVHLPGGYNLFVPADTVMVASVRYTGSVQFQAQAFNANAADAQRLSDQLGAVLAFLRSVEARQQAPAGDEDVKAFLDSLKVEREDARTTLTASVPSGFVKKVFGEKQ